jgi:hypothetical protein
MRVENNNHKKRGMLLAATAVALTAGTTAYAQDPTVTMTLGDYSSHADVVNLGDLIIPGNPTDSGYIGIYSFSVQNNGGVSALPNNGGSFWTTCLSPAGEIGGGSPAATYSYETYAQANNGINPSAWAWNGITGSGEQDWGIQNANYLWEKVQGGASQPILTPDQSTALVLAMYAALYNSEGYGELGGSKFVFNSDAIETGSASTVAADYSTYLGLLDLSAQTYIPNNLSAGYVLVPTSQTQNGDPYGQEFIFMAPSSGNVVVPEPGLTGVMAGLGGLLFAVRTRFRKN